jgi:hypothetical protein
MQQMSRAREHQHVEWKECWRDEYLKWICASRTRMAAYWRLDAMTEEGLLASKMQPGFSLTSPTKCATSTGTALRAYGLVGGVSVSTRAHGVRQPKNHRGSYRGSRAARAGT